MHHELIDTALKLACHVDHLAPTQCDLRRAMSTAYYAIFHFTATSCAKLLAGGQNKSMQRAEAQVFRSLDHKDIQSACALAMKPEMNFPQPIRDYARVCSNSYKSRLIADYDSEPSFVFSEEQVLNRLGEVEDAIKRFSSADADDRRAFAVLLAVKMRKRT